MNALCILMANAEKSVPSPIPPTRWLQTPLGAGNKCGCQSPALNPSSHAETIVSQNAAFRNFVLTIHLFLNIFFNLDFELR